jgi:hypothetical protein
MKIYFRVFIALIAVNAFLTGHSRGSAADLTLESDSDGQVTVQYATGVTEIATMAEGVKYYTNRDLALQDVPAEIIGMSFTRRIGGKPSAVEIDVPAGATVYLLTDSDVGRDARPELNKRLAATGWSRLLTPT